MQIPPRQQRQQSLSTGKECITTYDFDNSECTLYILPKDVQICDANTKVHRPPAPHRTPCCLRRAKYCVILRLKQRKSTHMRYVKVRSSPVMQQHVVYIEFTVFVARYLASNLILAFKFSGFALRWSICKCFLVLDPTQNYYQYDGGTGRVIPKISVNCNTPSSNHIRSLFEKMLFLLLSRVRSALFVRAVISMGQNEMYIYI